MLNFYCVGDNLNPYSILHCSYFLSGPAGRKGLPGVTLPPRDYVRPFGDMGYPGANGGSGSMGESGSTGLPGRSGKN